ncbi:MAG: addiction module protein [Kofleriaceae bacterium]|nr:addiction module protein [Kofleriaceae bacterium]
MTALAQKILDEALSLPKDERHRLIEALAESLDLSATEFSPEWHGEIKSRIAQIESGDVELVSWSEIRADVDTQLP